MPYRPLRKAFLIEWHQNFVSTEPHEKNTLSS